MRKRIALTVIAALLALLSPRTGAQEAKTYQLKKENQGFSICNPDGSHAMAFDQVYLPMSEWKGYFFMRVKKDGLWGLLMCESAKDGARCEFSIEPAYSFIGNGSPYSQTIPSNTRHMECTLGENWLVQYFWPDGTYVPYHPEAPESAVWPSERLKAEAGNKLYAVKAGATCKSRPEFVIRSVVQGSDFTCIRFAMTAKDRDRNFYLYEGSDASSAYRIVAEGTQYMLTGLKGVGNNNHPTVVKMGSTLEFEARFEKMPDYITSFDLIEGTNGNGFDFKGVSIIPATK